MRLYPLASLTWFAATVWANLKFKDINEAIPELSEIPNPWVYNPIGGLEFGVCCLRAVSESYKLDSNNELVQTPNPFLKWDPAEFPLKPKQFPCTAEYADNKDGSPPVEVPYRWCRDNCPGWQRSHNGNLGQWIQPFVGYILPAAVFSLTVPRKRTFNIPEKLFPNKVDDVITEFNKISKANSVFGHIKPTVLALVSTLLIVIDIIIRAALAAAIGFVDTLVWTAMVFSTAGPMILSGLYEANVDRQVITYVERHTNQKLKPEGPGSVKGGAVPQPDVENSAEKASEQPAEKSVAQSDDVEIALPPAKGAVNTAHMIHLLYAVLVGNLELRTETPARPSPRADSSPNAWSHINHLVSLLSTAGTPTQPSYEPEVTRNRLQTMLGSQARFGVTVAAALCFFLGSFLVNVFGNLENLGQNDTSHALAFGEWWMTIPFVAIVAGCLLAGNNPNTLRAVMSGTGVVVTGSSGGGSASRSGEGEGGTGKARPKFWSVAFFREAVMPSLFAGAYEPVWMWERGRNKRRWIEHVQKQYGEQDHVHEKSGWLHSRLTVLKGRFAVVFKGEDLNQTGVPYTTLPDWLSIFLLLVALLLIPFTLAFLTSYYTPIIGLGCRSFTFVLYFLFQCLLSVLWLVDFTGSRNVFSSAPAGEADDDGPRIRSKAGRVVFGLLFVVFFFFSIFSAIAGTFMQIAGVYRNCKCLVPMAYWGNPDEFKVVISSNAKDDIRYATQYWKNNGIAAIALLGIVCYSGWWYQRHWRLRLSNCIDAVVEEAKKASSGTVESAPIVSAPAGQVESEAKAVPP